MEQPKARLTLQQSQQAINEAIWIDASPHEWPTIDKMWLLCSALIDSVQMVDYLRIRLAAVEAERDAARAGEARAVECLGTLNHAAKVAISTNYGNSEDEDTPLTILLLDGTCDATDELLTAATPALAWLAQQRREAAAKENDRWANEWWELARPTSLTASDFTERAAALRAGEGGE